MHTADSHCYSQQEVQDQHLCHLSIESKKKKKGQIQKSGRSNMRSENRR